MGIAMLAAKRSKDPNTQVGACIVSPDNIIISTGYNGMPKGCSDDEYPWDREGSATKYPYVVHAELNAVLNANEMCIRDRLGIVQANESRMSLRDSAHTVVAIPRFFREPIK